MMVMLVASSRGVAGLRIVASATVTLIATFMTHKICFARRVATRGLPPAAFVAAVVAVVAALPSIVVALYGATVGRFFQQRPRYTTRGSFARGDYANVASDEGELLGDESDEEV